MQRLSLWFYAKKKRLSDGNVPIFLKFQIDDQRSEISTMRSIHPDRWGVKQRKAIGNSEEARSINQYIKQLELDMYESFRVLSLQHEKVTTDLLKQKLRRQDDPDVKIKRSFVKIFEEHNDEVKTLIGQDYSLSTFKKYRTTLSHLKEFIKHKYHKDDIEVSAINHEFVKGLDYFIRSVKKNNNNTTIKYMRLFGKLVRRCMASGWIKQNPFLGYKTKSTEVIRDFLTMEEIDRIREKQFSLRRLREVRDIFIFSCYTGLSFIDVQKLQRKQIVEVSGQKWIMTARTKTDTASQIPVLPVAQEIIERYKDHPEVERTGAVLPVLSNQKTNSYLKEIAAACDIDKLLTFHIARHTFATAVTLNNGVSIEAVSKMLGHRSLRTTQHYAKILNQTVLTQMMDLKMKLDANPNRKI